MRESRIVIGLGFGDEGKGMAVAHEVERDVNEGLNPVVVRFNGGPQAAHNVRVVRDGKVLHHTHAQFGSGAMLGAETLMTDGMLFDPMSFLNEDDHLSKVMGREMAGTVTVHNLCPVVTPIHAIVGRKLEEKRGDNRHGSTGLGIGVARTCENHARRHSDERSLVTVATLRKGVSEIYDSLAESVYLARRLFHVFTEADRDTLWMYSCMLRDSFVEAVDRGLDICECTWIDHGEHSYVFEGSQGMLLDKRVGWFPHVTYGDMDAFEARRLCGERKAKVIGVTRSYQTRHGNGPMPTEGTYDAPETDNCTSEWAGEFRTGLLDIPNLARAAEATCVDEIAVSHMDRYPGRCVTHWEGWGREDGVDRAVPCDMRVKDMDEDLLFETIHDECKADVTVIGRGPILSDWSDR